MATQYYHTRDPIANLRVRVVARKVSHGNARSDRGVPLGTSWSYSFQWQEKKWLSDRKTTKTKSATGKRRQQDDGDASSPIKKETEGTGKDGADHDDILLCSYIDADNYAPSHIQQDGSTVFSHSHLTNSSHSQQPTTSDVATRKDQRDRVALRERREETFRQMHLVLRIVDEESPTKGEDLVLATLRYYPHTGLLCSTPGFSTCLAVDETSDGGDEKGPMLTTYRVRSRSRGVYFEYALDNENDLFPAASQDDQRILKELQRHEEQEERAHREEWHNKHGDNIPRETIRGNQANTEKPSDDDQMLLLVEIISVRGVDSTEPIRVAMELKVPHDNASSGWCLPQGIYKSRTRLARPRPLDTGENFSAFGHHVPFHLTRRRLTNSTSTWEEHASHRADPTLLFSVFSVDSWTRERLVGHAELRPPPKKSFLDTEIVLSRPVLTCHEQHEDFFLGSEGDPCVQAHTLATHTRAEKSTVSSVLSGFGAQMMSIRARVRVRLHIIKSQPVIAAPSARLLPPLAALSHGKASSSDQTGVVKRSVEEIMQSVKASKRFTEASATMASLSMSSVSSVAALLSRLKDESGSRGTSPTAG